MVLGAVVGGILSWLLGWPYWISFPLSTVGVILMLGLAYYLSESALPFRPRDRYPLHRLVCTTSSLGTNRLRQILNNKWADPNERDLDGNTALGLAAENQAWMAVVAFLEAGASPDVRTHGGHTPLTVAIAPDRRTYVIEELVKGGARIDLPGKNGRTPLVEACLARHEEIIKFLLSKGANTAIRDKEGKTAWDYVKADADLNRKFESKLKTDDRL